MTRRAPRSLVAVVGSLFALSGLMPVAPVSVVLAATPVFINEVHYDNTGTDAGEFIEIAGPAGTNLTGWSIVLYNGTGGTVYDTRTLTGTIPNLQSGFGTVSVAYPVNGIQNGAPDGIALVDSSSVVQFLSYEGSFVAVGGAANGMPSTDIGVTENGSEAVGLSIGLTGTGTMYEDFTWSTGLDDSPGATNPGQTFSAGLSLSINDVSANEGNAGTTTFSFTVSLSAAAPAGGVTFDIATDDDSATAADNDYVTKSLTSQAITAGNSTYTFDVTVNGDATVEPDEAFFVNVTNVTGATLGDGQGTGTIVDDDSGTTRIHTIQGSAHLSPLVGTAVTTSGVVTANAPNGFWIQEPDATVDADPATSEGIFVFTSTAPTVSVGDHIQVDGNVAEFRPGGATNPNLTTTELTGPTIVTLSTGNPLPSATVIGAGGRVPPATVIDDDATGSVETSGSFDASTDGIDFFESLEGMRAQVNNAVVVGPNVGFGEIFVLPDGGAGQTTRTTRGGIIIEGADFNPGRVKVDDLLISGMMPAFDVGATIPGAIVGPVDYNFGNFGILATSAPAGVPSAITREVTQAADDPDELAVATFNVENLDPGDPDAKFQQLATMIVNNLQAPDLISLEEIQDNNGPTNNGIVAADQTLAELIAAIQAAGGPTYQFRQIDPENLSDGGEPGGNIRVGFLFRTDRGLAFVDRPGATSTTSNTVAGAAGAPELQYSPGRIDPTNAAFNNSRKPLAGEFTFNGRRIFVIANHFNSKGGDNPLFGRFQPPTLVTEAQREQQATVVKAFVDDILALDPSAAVVVLGDLNDFEFSTPLEILEGTPQVLTPLIETLPAGERYSYVFDGNSQTLDHILVSNSLVSGTFEFDSVHANAEFADQASDHDPQVARFTITDDAPTPIHEIQGSGDTAAPGTFTVEAIVVGDYQTQGSGQLRGFFLQEEDEDADADAATSEGIFVFCNTCPVGVSVGDAVRVTGPSSEFFGMSQLTASSVSSVTVLSSGNSLPTPGSVELPVPGVPNGDLAAATAAINAYFEPFEGMLVTHADTLSVTDYFELARYGQLILSEGGRPHTFTAVNAPSAAGLIDHEIDLARRSVILDDTDNRQNRPVDTPNTAYYHPVPGLSTGNFVRGGDTITNLTGVLHWSFAGQTGTDAWRIRPVTEAFGYDFTSANPRPSSVPDVGGSLTVAGFNVLNYFLTIDTTSGDSGPCGASQTLDCRGADSAAELALQRAKLLAALSTMDADIFGLMEMENTPGVNPLADIVAGLPGYAYVDTGVVGTDAIRVGFIYKTSAVQPVGDHAILDSTVDPRFIDTRNRPALAQTFEEVATGARLTVVVNHLKSKGSGCGAGDDDTTTGQGNCNGTRTLAAEALADWLATDPTGSGDEDVLIIGDLNSYAKEDPIAALQGAGFTDLVAEFGGPGAYGFVFDGQLGYLDHGMSNASLTPQVTGAAEWHINADEIPLFDYNDDVRSTGEATFEEESDVFPLYEANQFRSSDHDPVMVGLDLTLGPLHLHNNPTPPVGNTRMQHPLPMDADTPTATTLFNYDRDRDSFPGRLIQKGGSATTSDRTKFQNWRTQTFGRSVDIEGDVTFEFWSAMKDFKTNKKGSVTAYLMDGSTVIATASLRPSAAWQGGSRTWVEKTITFTGVDRTIAAGRFLQLRVVVANNSADDMWFAYDTASFQSKLILP